MHELLIIMSIEDLDILSSTVTSVLDSLYIPSVTVVSIVGSLTTGSLREFSSGQDQDGFTPVISKSQKRRTTVEKQHRKFSWPFRKPTRPLLQGQRKVIICDILGGDFSLFLSQGYLLILCYGLGCSIKPSL